MNEEDLFTIAENGDISIIEIQFIKLLDYISQNRKIMKLLFLPEYQQKSQQLLHDTFNDIADRSYEKSNKLLSLHPIIPEDYYDRLLFSSMFQTISHWLSKDCKESPEQIANILIHLSKL